MWSLNRLYLIKGLIIHKFNSVLHLAGRWRSGANGWRVAASVHGASQETGGVFDCLEPRRQPSIAVGRIPIEMLRVCSLHKIGLSVATAKLKYTVGHSSCICHVARVDFNSTVFINLVKLLFNCYLPSRTTVDILGNYQSAQIILTVFVYTPLKAFVSFYGCVRERRSVLYCKERHLMFYWSGYVKIASCKRG